MMLAEVTQIAQTALPLDAFKQHLRLGSGFGMDGFQDNVLESVLRAAIAAIEGRTGKILLERVFRWTLDAWRDVERQPLPLAPVGDIVSVTLVDADGQGSDAPAGWVLSQDMHRPALVAKSGCLPRIPPHGEVQVIMRAGFGPGWADLPQDLAHAVMMLAAHYYEFRQDAELPGRGVPHGVAALIERYRTVRLFGGGRA